SDPAKAGRRSRLCRCAYRTARRPLAKLVDNHSEIDGVFAVNAGDAGLVPTDPAPSRFRLLRRPGLRADPSTLALLLRRRRLGFFRPRDPVRQPIKIEINDRGREEGQRLTDDKAADHRVAERLSHFGSTAVA